MELRSVALPFEGISILQDIKSQAISSDSEFLYNTIISFYSDRRNAKNLKMLELGSGNGVISIMLALASSTWQITAMEVQISQFLLARRNIKKSGVNINLILADLRKTELFGDSTHYDLIYANPPYFPAGTTRISPSLTRAISRYELLADMDDLLNAVKDNLTPDGEAFILYPAIRLPDLRSKVEYHGLDIHQEIVSNSEDSSQRGRREIPEEDSGTRTISILRHITG